MRIPNLLIYDMIIAPRSFHHDLLIYKQQNLAASFKLLTKEKVLSEFYFKIDDKAITATMIFAGCNFQNAQTLLSSIHYGDISDKNPKIRKLGLLKEHLSKLDLLETNPYFAYEMKQRNVAVIGYGEDIELIHILQSCHSEYNVIDFKMGEFLPEIFSFTTLDEEVHYVMNDICFKVDNGMKQEDIRILATSEEYVFAFNKASQFYNLPVFYKNSVSMLSSPLIQKDLRIIADTSLAEYSENHPETNIINDVVERYQLMNLPKEQQYESLIAALSQMQRDDSSSQVVEILTDLPLISNKFTYLLGFNQGVYPPIHKNDDYLSDEEKRLKGIMTSVAINKISKARIIDFITNSPHLMITYKEQGLGQTYYPSSLILELSLAVTKRDICNLYSRRYGELVLSCCLDSNRKFGKSSRLLNAYQNEFDVAYRKFDYRFSGIMRAEKVKAIYSYSKLKTFFQCQFAYYCMHILKLDTFTPSFATEYGNLAHSILEHVYDQNFDFDTVFASLIKNHSFSVPEKVFLNRRKEDLRQICINIRNHFKKMQVRGILNEQEVTHEINDSVTITGKIDRIIITGEKEKQYYTIIDYKTGNEELDLDLIAHGYSMQLPVYAYLWSKFDQEKKLLGLYIQPLLLNKIGIPCDDISNFYQKNVKLKGITIDDQEAIKTFDPSFACSDFIQGLKQKNSGEFYHYSKVISYPELEILNKQVEDLIISADAKIRNNDFIINPKNIEGDDACKYCTFADVCFKNRSAYVYLKTSKGEQSDVD